VTIQDWARVHPANPPMDDQVDGAGVCVVIDVLRAFTTAAILLARGASEIRCVESAADAFTLARTTSPVSIVVGEQLHPRLQEVDLPNSPTAVLESRVARRPVAFFTSNGTPALATVGTSSSVFAASLVNATATAKWISNHHPDSHVRLLVTDPLGPEDRGCALHIEALLTTGIGKPSGARAAAMSGVESHRRRWARHVSREVWQRFLADSLICADLDAYPLVMRGSRGPGGAVTLTSSPNHVGHP